MYDSDDRDSDSPVAVMAARATPPHPFLHHPMSRIMTILIGYNMEKVAIALLLLSFTLVRLVPTTTVAVWVLVLVLYFPYEHRHNFGPFPVSHAFSRSMPPHTLCVERALYHGAHARRMLTGACYPILRPVSRL